MTHNEYAKALDISKDIINRFRFDFAITDNDNIAYFIEVDGIQHFQYIQHFFKIWDRFFERCTSDKNKNSFAELSKIPLLRIRYDQLDHAEEMIDDMLMNPSKYIKQHNTYLSEGQLP